MCSWVKLAWAINKWDRDCWENKILHARGRLFELKFQDENMAQVGWVCKNSNLWSSSLATTGPSEWGVLNQRVSLSKGGISSFHGRNWNHRWVDSSCWIHLLSQTNLKRGKWHSEIWWKRINEEKKVENHCSITGNTKTFTYYSRPITTLHTLNPSTFDSSHYPIKFFL